MDRPKERVQKKGSLLKYHPRKNAPREEDAVLESWKSRNIASLKILLMYKCPNLLLTTEFIRLPLRKPKVHW